MNHTEEMEKTKRPNVMNVKSENNEMYLSSAKVLLRFMYYSIQRKRTKKTGIYRRETKTEKNRKTH